MHPKQTGNTHTHAAQHKDTCAHTHKHTHNSVQHTQIQHTLLTHYTDKHEANNKYQHSHVDSLLDSLDKDTGKECQWDHTGAVNEEQYCRGETKQQINKLDNNTLTKVYQEICVQEELQLHSIS